MREAGRIVVLLLDNATSHPSDLNLTHVKLVFLPANTTSKLQPLDQGIIKNMNQFYKKKLLRSVVSKIGDDTVNVNSVSKCITVLDAIQWVSTAVKEGKAETVNKCFLNAGVTAFDDADIDDELR
ncbi:tigger transposable element-derived protein 6-like [Mya arenaria]|uniref:tigger transposable element-derived protein 6-like n=1 Tax=Mya arenaria TaxID=6604 RepID=UPI0022DFB539|nr:tigger transposable element-derived protein 6-like [Mya arenaria]